MGLPIEDLGSRRGVDRLPQVFYRTAGQYDAVMLAPPFATTRIACRPMLIHHVIGVMGDRLAWESGVQPGDQSGVIRRQAISATRRG